MMTTQEDDSLPPGGLHSLPPLHSPGCLTRVTGGGGGVAAEMGAGRGGGTYPRGARGDWWAWVSGAGITLWAWWARIRACGCWRHHHSDVMGQWWRCGRPHVRRGAWGEPRWLCLAAFLYHHQASPALRRRTGLGLLALFTPRRLHFCCTTSFFLFFSGGGGVFICFFLHWKGKEWKLMNIFRTG